MTTTKSVRIKRGPAARAARLPPTSTLRKQSGLKSRRRTTRSTKKKAEKADAKRCRCYARVEKVLAKHYPHIKLDPVFVFGRGRTETCFRIATEKEKGSRKSNVAITPSFCPFCGVRTTPEGEDLLASFDGMTIKKRTPL